MAVHFGVTGVRNLITGVVLGVIEFPAPVVCRLNRLRMQIAAPNSEGDTLFNVKVNGVSIYASPADRPKILEGETVSETFPSVALEEGDIVSVDVVSAPLGGISGLYVLVQLQDAPTVEQYVEQVYQGALKRAPSSEELDDAVAVLEGGCAAAATLDDTKALIDLVFNSDEYEDLETTDEEFIEDLYLAVLARPSDPGGKTFYLERLGTVWTRQQVQDIFNTSAEHINARVNGWCAATLMLSNAVQFTGRNVSSASPSQSQVFAWNATTSQWEPTSFDFLNGAVDFKTPGARAATTAALPSFGYAAGVITASANGALPAQDGITLVAGETLLVKNEAGANEKYNGPYIVTQVGSAGTPFILTRRSDANTSAQVTAGMMIAVEEGTINGDTIWWLTTNNPITLDTTALTFSRFGSTIALGLRETSGPTDLTIGAVADNEFLKRSGSTIVGATPSSGGGGVNWLGPWSSATTYAAGDVVTYRGSTFLAVAGSTNVTPGSDTSKWVAIAGDAVLFEAPPASASTLELWLRGDWIAGWVANLGLFTRWCDGSGKGRHAQPAGNPASIAAGSYTSAPLWEETGGPNNQPCIRLDAGSGAFLWLPGFQRTSWAGAEILIIFKNDDDPTTGSDTGHLVGGWGTASFAATFFTDGNIYDDFGQSTRYDTGNPSASLTSWRLYNVRLTPSATNGWQLYIDSTLHFQTNSGALSWSARKSMIGRAPSNSQLKTRIAEIAFFKDVLSSGDRTSWTTYLNTRYSLSL